MAYIIFSLIIGVFAVGVENERYESGYYGSDYPAPNIWTFVFGALLWPISLVIFLFILGKKWKVKLTK